MLIQHAAPRIRPPGGPVFRVRRLHPLAAELRALVLFGGDAGVGVDLVTRQALTASSAPVPFIGEDGPMLDPAAGYGILGHDGGLNITGDVTIAFRARALGADAGLVTKDGGGNGATNTPFFLAGSLSGLYFVRSNSGYRAYQSNTAGFNTSRTQTLGVSSVNVSTAPTFYFDGAASTAYERFTNGGSGTPGTNTNPLHFGNGGGAHLALAAIAARIWSADEHAGFHADPYALVEDAPLYHFLTAGQITYDLTAQSIASGAPTVGTPTLGIPGETGALGGDDAPAAREDIDRLARRRRRLEREEDARAARLRASLERAYRAATGAAEEATPDALAEAEDALQAAAAVAPDLPVLDIAPLLGTAQALQEIQRLLLAVQRRRDRLRREEDELAMILSVL